MNDKTKFQDDDFVGRWISQDLSDAEALEFEQWIAANPEEKKTFEELKSTWEAYGKSNSNRVFLKKSAGYKSVTEFI